MLFTARSNRLYMTHPEWVLKHKQKNSEIRYLNGRYYLYKITSKWDPDKKRTKKVTLGMIGVITEQEGLVPKGVLKKGRSPKEKPLVSVFTKEYGATKFLEIIGSDIIEKLKENFHDLWENIWALSLCRLLYQAPLKRCEFLYQESFLSEVLLNISLGKNNLTDFMQVLGSGRGKISSFMKNFVEGAEHIVFDATSIVSHSASVRMSSKGYNPNSNYDPQVNLFYMFDTSKKEPNYYRLFPGNIQGSSALKHAIMESGANNVIAIGDKGFCSENNMKYLDETEIKYILPLKRSSKYIDYTRLAKSGYDNLFDGHFIYQDRVIFYTNNPQLDGRKLVTFTDKNLKLEEEKTYLKRIDQDIEGYSMEGYKEKEMKFGTISMITNCLDLEPQDIYIKYKSRMEIETVFDMYKNLLEADRTYMRSDKSMEGWIFINHIATMLYYRIFKLLKDKKLITQISPYDLITKLLRINKVKINKNWVTAEINSGTKKLLSLLGIVVT